MASSVLGTSFCPLFRPQQNKRFSSIASTKISTTNRQKINGVVAAQVQSGVNEESKSCETRQNLQGPKSLNFSGEKPVTPILDTINDSIHRKNTIQELEALEEIVYTLSKTGGHLSSNLGVVELTVALHHVFDTPQDKIIWDVGHQSYVHKILTGRRSRMQTIRRANGLCGFPNREESVHDAFGVGHSSTSISAGLGMAFARDLGGKDNHVVSVIGDGAMTAGLAFEGLNNAGCPNTNLIIILNDNQQVSLPTATLDAPALPVGALSKALKRLQTCANFHLHSEAEKAITNQVGSQTHDIGAKLDSSTNGPIAGGSGACLFEIFGLYYVGPVDGHNVKDLITILEKIKAMPELGPVLIHVVTEKGKGYPPAEAAFDKLHAVGKFDPKSGKQYKSKTSTSLYTNYFVESLIAEAQADDKIVAIHAAMAGSTGLNIFQKRFPERCLDVGMAEQHAVTFAARLAAQGFIPFVAMNSSFLQGGYDQVIHDVGIQSLPVRFATDRAGLTGVDSPTHYGTFDITYKACLPNMVVMAPSDETELMHMVATAIAIDDRPCCFRYPKGYGIGSILPPNNKCTSLETGRGRILKEGSRVALVGYGTMVQSCMAAAKLLEDVGISTTVADARFCKPLDGVLMRQLAKEHEILITVEEGSLGGFAAHVSHFLSFNGLLDGNLKWRGMTIPDKYIGHASPSDQIEPAGLNSKHIAATALPLTEKQWDSPMLLPFPLLTSI